MEQIEQVNSTFKSKMDYEQFFPDQEVMNHVKECNGEIVGTLVVVNGVLLIAGLIVLCSQRNASKQIETLEQKNRTLKGIIFSAMESGIIRMMYRTPESPHED